MRKLQPALLLGSSLSKSPGPRKAGETSHIAVCPRRRVSNRVAENCQDECYQLGTAWGPGRGKEHGLWEDTETDLAVREKHCLRQEPATEFFINSLQPADRNLLPDRGIFPLLRDHLSVQGDHTLPFRLCSDVPTAATTAPEGMNHEMRDRPRPQGCAARPQPPSHTLQSPPSPHSSKPTLCPLCFEDSLEKPFLPRMQLLAP